MLESILESILERMTALLGAGVTDMIGVAVLCVLWRGGLPPVTPWPSSFLLFLLVSNISSKAISPRLFLLLFLLLICDPNRELEVENVNVDADVDVDLDVDERPKDLKGRFITMKRTRREESHFYHFYLN